MENRDKEVMRITLVVRSGLKKILKMETLEITIEEGSDFLSLVARLNDEYGEKISTTFNTEKYGFSWFCVRNKKMVLPTEVLEEGDRVMFLPPLAGG